MVKLSIIVPVYNVERYLKECVNSLLIQSYKDLEIILVDDGSTDESGNICDAFAQTYSNIKVVHQNNQGLPHARNAGLRVATGEFIGFVDSDDVIKKDMYKRLIQVLEKNKADLSVCNYEVFNKVGVHAISTRYKNQLIEFSEKNEKNFFCISIDSACNKVFRRNIINQNSLRFEDKSIVAQEDFWFLFRYCCCISKIVSISDSLYQYRERASSITKSGIDNDITLRCINFLQLSSAFAKSVHKNAETFLKYATFEMLFAAINQMPQCNLKGVMNIIKLFRETEFYNIALNKSEGLFEGKRKKYNKFLRFLLKTKNYFFFSLLESIRVRRLRRLKNLNNQFE